MPFTPQIKFFDPMTSVQFKQILKWKNLSNILEMIEFSLSMKNHINFICHRISKSVGIIAKLGHLYMYIPCCLLL